MSYSQRPLIALLKRGQIVGETTTPKHIETVISNVFIFDSTVYKLYKNDNEFFNKGFRDVSTKLERFDFTRRDFEWNHTLSPSIYLKLAGAIVVDDKITLPEPTDSAEELLIVMNRVDTSNILFEKLLRGEVDRGISYSIGEQLGQTLKKVRVNRPTGYNYFDIFEKRISDLRQWITPVAEHISLEESGSYCDYLDSFRVENREWFESDLSNELAANGDVHSHNAVFLDGNFYLMDTFSPKEEWSIEHHSTAIYRIGVDIWALSGDQELFENLLHGYEESSRMKIDRRLDELYIPYALAIMVSYLYMLGRTDPGKKPAARKFHQFLRDYFKRLTS